MQTGSSEIKRFLLIDNHPLIRSALKSQCLETYPNSIVEESADGKEIMERLDFHFYNLVIIDIQIPNCDTLLVIKSITLNFPNVPILVYSMVSPSIYALRVIKAGAMGFVSKDAPLQELETAIGLALQGKRYICEEVASKITDGSFTDSENPFSTLSMRQLQIASLLLLGHTVTEISGLLKLGMSTVGTHKGKIFQKLNVSNLLELKKISDLHHF
jgi:two-component system, NarL family, invasion response regulator UvrY